MTKKFLGESQVEPPTHEVVEVVEVVDVDYSAADQRIIMLHGEKARGVSTYEMGRGSELMEYGLTWVGWLEKYSSYAKREVEREVEREGGGTPILQQTIVEELMRADADARAQKTWFGDEPGESAWEARATGKGHEDAEGF